MTRPATVPQGYATVTPWLISKDTPALIAWLQDVLGAEELARIPNPDGTIGHAEVRIGDSVVMLFDARPEWPDSPAYLRVYVADADAVFARALAAGAEPVTRVTELAWGDRVGRVRDPFGNVWWLQERVAEPTPEELQRRFADPAFAEAMRYVQSAEIVRRA